MPRKLIKVQKKLLDTAPVETITCDELPMGMLNKLVALNDYETIYQDIDRYLWDRATEARYKK